MTAKAAGGPKFRHPKGSTDHWRRFDARLVLHVTHPGDGDVSFDLLRFSDSLWSARWPGIQWKITQSESAVVFLCVFAVMTCHSNAICMENLWRSLNFSNFGGCFRLFLVSACVSALNRGRLLNAKGAASTMVISSDSEWFDGFDLSKSFSRCFSFVLSFGSKHSWRMLKDLDTWQPVG